MTKPKVIKTKWRFDGEEATKPKAKKPVERKFKHGEIVGKIDDEFLLASVMDAGNRTEFVWREIGKRLGVDIYFKGVPHGRPAYFVMSCDTGELRYTGRTQK